MGEEIPELPSIEIAENPKGEKATEKKDAGTNTSSKDFGNVFLRKDPPTEKENNLRLILKDFEELHSNQRFADVILKLGKHEFPAHKAILASRSKVFEAMFEHDMLENRQHTVDLLDMEPDTVKDMLRYIYCGKVRELSPEESLNLYIAADRYDLQELVLHCRKIILNSLSIDNLFEVSTVADLHNDQLLMDEVKSILCKDMKEILKTDQWILFAKQNPILSLDLIRSAILNE
ncbi:TD and POZ domain-containing protein 4-like [Uloborus diversus]|uniref:TD and POZ domain-containing protein 4-like n=1 Tax=Uloborus diversus TaxID=327109 RepID=UPI00240A1B1C|nr:TD and POZ domain-containing protein 4-like [Uloborus diversus]